MAVPDDLVASDLTQAIVLAGVRHEEWHLLSSSAALPFSTQTLPTEKKKNLGELILVKITA